jgi:hypothetical protein
MAGVNFCLHQVKIKMWVDCANLCWVIAIAVVALCENSNQVNVSILQGFCKFFLIEAFANTLNGWACVKIEVNALHIFSPIQFFISFLLYSVKYSPSFISLLFQYKSPK